MIPVCSSLVPTLIKDYLFKKQILIPIQMKFFKLERRNVVLNFLKLLKAFFFIGAGAGVGAGEKKYLETEPVKNGPAPQHCL